MMTGLSLKVSRGAWGRCVRSEPGADGLGEMPTTLDSAASGPKKERGIRIGRHTVGYSLIRLLSVGAASLLTWSDQTRRCAD